jgi:hypothetical protein
VLMAYGFDRFLTTHTGSLPRPDDLIRAMFAKEEGVPVDRAALAARISTAVAKFGFRSGWRENPALIERSRRIEGFTDRARHAPRLHGGRTRIYFRPSSAPPAIH